MLLAAAGLWVLLVLVVVAGIGVGLDVALLPVGVTTAVVAIGVSFGLSLTVLTMVAGFAITSFMTDFDGDASFDEEVEAELEIDVGYGEVEAEGFGTTVTIEGAGTVFGLVDDPAVKRGADDCLGVSFGAEVTTLEDAVVGVALFVEVEAGTVAVGIGCNIDDVDLVVEVEDFDGLSN